MISIEEVKDALYDACSLIAVVSDDDLLIIKDEICNFDGGKTVSIYKLFSSIKGFVHEKSYKRYDTVFDTERVAHILADNEHVCLTPEFQLKLSKDGKYQPYQFCIVRNSDLTLIAIRQADKAYTMLENATAMMHNIMIKILKVNTTNDTYADIKVTGEQDIPKKFSEWWKKFAEYNVAEDDKKDFLDFGSRLNTMYKEYGEMPQSVIYRRCVNSAEYKWSVLYAVPSKDYSEDNKELYIFVIDIQHQYILQAEKARRVGIDEYYDAETGLQNKRAFCNRIARLHGQKAALAWIGLRDELPIGCKDHKAYVRSTANMIVDEYGEDRCYRISENEFVVLNVGSHRLDATISADVMFGTAYVNGEDGYGDLYDAAVKDATW